jgi:hypothetical protein
MYTFGIYTSVCIRHSTQKILSAHQSFLFPSNTENRLGRNGEHFFAVLRQRRNHGPLTQTRQSDWRRRFVFISDSGRRPLYPGWWGGGGDALSSSTFYIKKQKGLQLSNIIQYNPEREGFWYFIIRPVANGPYLYMYSSDAMYNDRRERS